MPPWPGRSPRPHSRLQVVTVTLKRMTERLSLAGFGAAPALTDRLFFAVFPDTGAAARIAALAQALRNVHGLKNNAIATERLHVTLHLLGDYAGVPKEIVATAEDAAAAVATPPFEVGFDRVRSFRGKPGKRPCVLCGGDGAVALSGFQQALGAALRHTGLALGDERPYTPHVTLLYDSRRVAEQAVEPIAWTAREFVLVRSLIGQGRYLPLARWPLRG